MSDFCDKCHDGDGGTVYPYHGVGPHICWPFGRRVSVKVAAEFPA